MPQQKLQNSSIYDEILEKFRKSMGAECSTVRMFENAREVLDNGTPLFTEQHLHFFSALLATYKVDDTPIATGFDQESLLRFAESTGRYQGMLDLLSYLTEIVSHNQVRQPQQPEE